VGLRTQKIMKFRLGVAFAALVIGVWVIGLHAFQYSPIANLASNSDLNDDQWTVSGSASNTIQSDRSISILPAVHTVTSITRGYPLSAPWLDGAYVDVLARYASLPQDALEGVPLADSASDASLIYLWFLRHSDNKRWTYSFPLSAVAQNKQNQAIQAIVPIPPTADEVHFGMLLRDMQQGFTMNTMSLLIIEKSIVYKVASALLLLAFVVFSVVAIQKLVAATGKMKFLLFATITLLLLVFISVSGTALKSFIQYSLPYIGLNATDSLNINDVQYLGHATGYFFLTLGALFTFSARRKPSAYFWAAMFLSVLLTEGIQLHRPDRTVEIADLLFNCLGVMLGLVLWSALRAIRPARKRSAMP